MIILKNREDDAAILSVVGALNYIRISKRDGHPEEERHGEEKIRDDRVMHKRDARQ